MAGFSILLLLCVAIPLGVALLFLALLVYSYRPNAGYSEWVRGSAQSWRADEETIKSVKPRPVSLETIMADSVPAQGDALIEARDMVGNARTFVDIGRQRVETTRMSIKNRSAKKDESAAE